LTNNI